MPFNLSFVCAICAFGCLSIAAAEPLLAPLAYSSAPTCSTRPGTRAVRSDLVQFGDVTASISAQASRENGTCQQSSALWITKKDVSEQVELRDVATSTFALLDISPDSSSILLSSVATFPNPEDDHSQQMAVLSLAEGSLKWLPLAEILSLRNCDASFEPQGFLDATHVAIAVLPLTSAHRHPNCTTMPVYFSFDTVSHAVRPSGVSGTKRFAQAVAPPVHSCKTDPDVVAACYSARARLAISDGQGMVVWPVGTKRVMSVEDDNLPFGLSSRVSPKMRVYATMVICPLAVDQPKRHPSICIDAATEFHLDPAPMKTAGLPLGKRAPVATGDSH